MSIVYAVIIAAAALVSLFVAMTGMAGTFILWLVVFIISLIEGFKVLSLGWLIAFFAAAVIAEIFEYFSGVLGSGRSGASASAMKGALLGGMIGAIILSALIPVWGFILGVFPGTFAGAFLGEYRVRKDFYKSSKAAMGALAGRVIAASFKVLVILLMGALAIARYSGLF